jgi:transposase InsO family protein
MYVHERIHSSLDYLTPAEFEAQWRQEHVLALEFELT